MLSVGIDRGEREEREVGGEVVGSMGKGMRRLQLLLEHVYEPDPTPNSLLRLAADERGAVTLV